MATLERRDGDPARRALFRKVLDTAAAITTVGAPATGDDLRASSPNRATSTNSAMDDRADEGNGIRMNEVDILVIGGGPGGTPAAMALAQAGKRVMLVDQGEGLGGTCLFEGCIPSKIFRETASRLRAAARARTFGIDPGAADPKAVWSEVMARKRAILSGRGEAALATARALSTLTVVRGSAVLLGPRHASVAAAGASPLEVRFDRAILATGSQATRPAFPGADLPEVWLSDRLLSIDRVPPSIVLVGGGPIGVEMAQIFRFLGSTVTLLHGGERILPAMEPDLALRLQAILREDGIDVRCGVRAHAIAPSSQGLAVQYLDARGKAGEAAGEHVALAVGREPRVDGLGLDTTRVQVGPQGVRVDAQLQTHEPGIYAAGDVVGQPMFAHWATMQSLAIAQHLLDRPAPFPRPEHNTAVIFSHPEFAIAGLTSAQARAAGLDVETATYDYAVDARAQIGAETGLLRLVFDAGTHRVLGVHALVEGASDVIGEAALAVRHGMTLEQLAQAIHPHPTLTEAMGVLARQALGRPRSEAAAATQHEA